jgi:hypothetical protein
MQGNGIVTIRLISFVLSFALGAAATAQAQDYSAGKTPAQLFASDCSGCHKSPQGLAKGYDVRSLASFLREHYTSKKESAGALASFVAAAGGGAPAATDRPARGSRTAAPAPEPKPAEPKPAEESSAARPSTGFPRIFPWQSAPDAKPEAKPEAAEAAPEPAKPTTGRRRTAAPTEAKEAEPSTPAIIRHQSGSRPAVRRAPAEAATAAPHGKPADAKSQDAKPGEPPAAQAKPVEAKPVESKPAAAKPAEMPRPAAATPADVPADKLKLYLESGHSAKPMEGADKPAGEKPVDAAGSRLNSYATSGDTAASKSSGSGGASKPAAVATPTEQPAADKGGEAKPSAGETRSEPAAAQ